MTKLEKLRHLIAVLEGVERDHKPFDMSDWFCDTAACASGWAALDPVFQAQGLSVFKNHSITSPMFKGRVLGFRAIVEFFEIDIRDAIFVFHQRSYPPELVITPRHVIARVQSLIDAECAAVTP